MNRSNCNRVLSVKRSYGLLVAVMAVIAICMTSCHTTAMPIDDAYYWVDKKAETATIPSVTSTTEVRTEASSPSIEYTNVQDTTVTIKIKR